MNGAGDGARWDMHWDEVAVFDANSSSLGVDEFDLMKAAGEALAREVAKSSGGGESYSYADPETTGVTDS